MDDQLIGFIVLAGFLGILLGIVPLPLVLLTRKSKYWSLFRDIGLWLGGFDLLCFLGLTLIYSANDLTVITFGVASGLSFLFLIGIYITKPPDVGQNGELSKTLKWFLITVLVLTILSIIFIWLRYENKTSSKSTANLASPTPSKTLTPTSFSASGSIDNWATYTNKTFNFSVKYPSNCGVRETAEYVTIHSPDSEGLWPYFQIAFINSEFSHPPAGTDVYEYISKNPLRQYDEIDPNKNIKIAGHSAIHTKYYQSPQADGSDFYFFIKGEQLFMLEIRHTGGKEDWDLYNKFLDSFTF